MKIDRHSQAMPDNILMEVQNLMAQIRELIKPYIVTLTPAERRDVPKMGDKSFSFVQKAYELAFQNPTLVPVFLEMPAFTTDFSDARNLLTLKTAARQIDEQLDDTLMAAGSEAYQSALVFYKSVQVAAANDVPGAKAVYEELRKRFPGRKHVKNDDDNSQDF